MSKLDFHQKAYVCTHVFDRERPVLLVSRGDDEDEDEDADDDADDDADVL